MSGLQSFATRMPRLLRARGQEWAVWMRDGALGGVVAILAEPLGAGIETVSCGAREESGSRRVMFTSRPASSQVVSLPALRRLVGRPSVGPRVRRILGETFDVNLVARILRAVRQRKGAVTVSVCHVDGVPCLRVRGMDWSAGISGYRSRTAAPSMKLPTGLP